MCTNNQIGFDFGGETGSSFKENPVGTWTHSRGNNHSLESYRTQIKRHLFKCSNWAGAYCADKIAFAGSGVASVPSFLFQGRRYINDGGKSFNDYMECEGWTFCSPEDWSGKTFNYVTQCDAWSDGSVERGDRRGLIIRVNGQLCIIDGAAIFYDDSIQNEIITYLDDAEEDLEDEETEIDESY